MAQEAFHPHDILEIGDVRGVGYTAEGLGHGRAAHAVDLALQELVAHEFACFRVKAVLIETDSFEGLQSYLLLIVGHLVKPGPQAASFLRRAKFFVGSRGTYASPKQEYLEDTSSLCLARFELRTLLQILHSHLLLPLYRALLFRLSLSSLNLTLQLRCLVKKASGFLDFSEVSAKPRLSPWLLLAFFQTPIW